jgi:hypothetical protein
MGSVVWVMLSWQGGTWEGQRKTRGLTYELVRPRYLKVAGGCGMMNDIESDGRRLEDDLATGEDLYALRRSFMVKTING